MECINVPYLFSKVRDKHLLENQAIISIRQQEGS